MEGSACGNRFSTWFKDAGNMAEFDHRYVFDEVGYNLKPLDLQGAMGLQQLKKLDKMHDKRRKNHIRQMKIWSKYEDSIFLPTQHHKADPSWFAFLMTIKDESKFTKGELVAHLEDAKIQTRSYFTGNALLHPAYKTLRDKYDDVQKEFPIATKVTSDSFFLGVWPGALDEHFDYIEKVAEEFMS